jgi:hypothetical protein
LGIGCDGAELAAFGAGGAACVGAGGVTGCRGATGAAGFAAAGAAFFGAGFGAADVDFLAALLSPAFTGEGRDLRPRRCALPITALRLTPPNSSAIWLAVEPLSHIFFNVAIRSSVQLIECHQFLFVGQRTLASRSAWP